MQLSFRLLSSPPTCVLNDIRFCADISLSFFITGEIPHGAHLFLSTCFRIFWISRCNRCMMCFRKRCIDIFVSLSSAFPVSRWSAFWFFDFIQYDHLSYTIRRLFIVILLFLTPCHIFDRMYRPRRWILLYLESLELLVDIFLHFDTRPHHNVQIVNFYSWHLLFVDFFDLRTSQLLIFKFVDWQYR